MKRLILLNAIIAIALISTAQNGKTINDANAQTRNLKGFHGVRIGGGIDLYLSQGTEAVAVSASKPEYRDKIKTVVENGILKIYLENTGSHLIWGFSNPKLKAYVSVTTIDKLQASGGSDVFIDKTIKSEKLDMNLSGGSDLHGQVDITGSYHRPEWWIGCQTFQAASKISVWMPVEEAISKVMTW